MNTIFKLTIYQNGLELIFKRETSKTVEWGTHLDLNFTALQSAIGVLRFL
jgi:hypothetical protein